MNPLLKEIKAVAAAISEPHDDAEAAAKAAILALDEARTERVTYFLVLKFGPKGNCFYQGIGPFSTVNQAEKAYTKHPAAGMATGRAVVPTMNHLGFEELLARVDAPAESRGNWSEVERDKAAFKSGWRGKSREREAYL